MIMILTVALVCTSWIRGWFLAPLAALTVSFAPTLLSLFDLEGTGGLGQLVGYLNGQGMLTMLAVAALVYTTAMAPPRPR